MFTPGLAGLVLGEFRRMADPETAAGSDTPELTERETEVLKMVAKGMSYKQIAERLVLSHRTVQNHVQNTLRKLQMHNRVELTRWAIEQGLDETTSEAVAAYLSFLGYDDRPPPTLESLSELHRRHLARIPYENLVDHARPAALGRPARLARAGGPDGGRRLLLPPERRPREGRSPTSASTSAAGQARSGGGEEERHAAALNHLVLVVTGLPTEANPGGDWWPDVGLGDAIVEPLPLLVGDYEQGGFRYAVTEVRDDGWSFRADGRGSFEGVEVGPAPTLDAVATCHERLSTPPDGHFTRLLVVQRRMPDHIDVVRGCLATDSRRSTRPRPS